MIGVRLAPGQRLPALLAAVVTLWAFLFAIAAFAGLGGRYRAHPDDPASVPALPALDLSQARNPLQPIETYADIGERPLFSPDRRPLPDSPAESPESVSEAAPAVPLDIAVTSIIMTPALKLVIVADNKTGKSQSLKVGQALEGDQSAWTLMELQPRKAVFSGPGGTSDVDLRVFNGTGGQAPSAPMASAKQEGQPVPPQSPAGESGAGAETAAPAAPAPDARATSPEERAEMIRQRIAERRRQMREEAERANNQ